MQALVSYMRNIVYCKLIQMQYVSRSSRFNFAVHGTMMMRNCKTSEVPKLFLSLILSLISKKLIEKRKTAQ